MYRSMMSTRTWTVLILREGTRSPLRINFPSWMLMGGQALALLALGYVGFVGWELQARYGLQGQQVAFLRLDKNAERWAAYEQLATSQLGPTRSELRAMIAEQRAKRLGLGNRKAASM